MEGPEIRAENVAVRCGACEAIIEVGAMEGPGDYHSEVVRCGCGEQYTVRLEVEA